MSMTTKKDIRSLRAEELRDYFLSIDEPKYRADQVYQWLWQKSAHSFSDMSNLPKGLRDKLEEQFIVHELTVHTRQKSADGTIKYAFELSDGNMVEGVLIPTAKRLTACISTQVGCSLACKFCATGMLKRMRNLAYSEIYDQVVVINEEAKREYGKGLTNIVYMGMGEPLLNYANTMESVAKITQEQGLHMSAKRITISTAGIAKMIRQMGEEKSKVKLALSLHAANDEKRNSIMAINESNNLQILAEALNYYYSHTKQKITFEYIIFKGFNDTLTDAKELLDFCRKVPSKVNIIEYNDVEGTEFKQADQDKVDAFAAYLENNGVIAKVRRSRGKDIDAACGQLANK
ncbi:MAG: 23S rRNA (adenine(2503)-C(2))-methyltransferase RlmN [Bacteroidetes bacterium]|jgi:23S rRNA (adenine2503-C2)-methyltransferase|nr:23S rRNA (adenine(2503)-C(2))-methyltransferase RlmN [Bacteroidota bacterium]